jgi:hypothetical protein
LSNLSRMGSRFIASSSPCVESNGLIRFIA